MPACYYIQYSYTVCHNAADHYERPDSIHTWKLMGNMMFEAVQL